MPLSLLRVTIHTCHEGLLDDMPRASIHAAEKAKVKITAAATPQPSMIGHTSLSMATFANATRPKRSSHFKYRRRARIRMKRPYRGARESHSYCTVSCGYVLCHSPVRGHCPENITAVPGSRIRTAHSAVTRCAALLCAASATTWLYGGRSSHSMCCHSVRSLFRVTKNSLVTARLAYHRPVMDRLLARSPPIVI
jgi:hypothetical protein